jgi:hypothetical protein
MATKSYNKAYLFNDNDELKMEIFIKASRIALFICYCYYELLNFKLSGPIAIVFSIHKQNLEEGEDTH